MRPHLDVRNISWRKKSIVARAVGSQRYTKAVTKYPAIDTIETQPRDHVIVQRRL